MAAPADGRGRRRDAASDHGDPAERPRETESAIRERLGVPSSAMEVVVVAESTHWDPDWLLRSEQYNRWLVRPALDRMLDALEAEPSRVFSLECTFFVDLYWQDRPERREQFRRLANDGRIHFTGSGVTTPDTLLPDEELIVRDLLLGQEWLRANGIDQEPRSLYLPDSFGHSPGLPSLLRATGYDRAVICRIAGMRFPGADMESAKNFPRPATAAADLLRAGTADFVWRASDGSEVLTHWMAHGYGHGDMIARGGLSRLMNLPASWPDRRPRSVDRRVERYLDDLRSVALTPYRLLAIGYDFVRPLPRLVELIARWNERNHERTGTWLVNGTVDDHLDLVANHRRLLPTFDLDPNPYWMGYYATRSSLKAATRELGRRLVATDAALATDHLAGTPTSVPEPDRAASWWTAVTSNHHDFVTGTAPDRVVRLEQEPWVARAIARTPWPDGTDRPAPSDRVDPIEHDGPQLRIEDDADLVSVEGPWGSVTFSRRRGGAAVSVRDASGRELAGGPSLSVTSYRDSGGLWRLGNEFAGGAWEAVDSSQTHPARVTVHRAADGGATVTVEALCDGGNVHMSHRLAASDPSVVTTLGAHPRRGRTLTLALRPHTTARSVTMQQPGGLVTRPLNRWYEPTFWPLNGFMSIDEALGSGGMTGSSDPAFVCASSPVTGAAVRADSTVEVIVARSPFKEIAHRVVPVMAPAWGWRTEPQRLTLAWSLTSRGDDHDAIRRGRHLLGLADGAAGLHQALHPFRIDDPDVEVTASKVADRGDGVIVRVRDWAAPEHVATGGRTVRLHATAGTARIVSAWSVDGRERDIAELAVADGDVEVPLDGHLGSVRVTVARPGGA